MAVQLHECPQYFTWSHHKVFCENCREVNSRSEKTKASHALHQPGRHVHGLEHGLARSEEVLECKQIFKFSFLSK